MEINMGKLIINQNLVTPKIAEKVTGLCPFGAISYKDGMLDISSACKMCKICAKKSEGVIEYKEDEKKVGVDKSAWRGICVFADITAGKLHRVTYELCGKAKELAAVTRHPVFAVAIGHNIREEAEKLLYYGVDNLFIYDDEAFGEFRVEPFTTAFCDFIDKHRPSSVLIGATNLGRQLAPRVAARCRTGLTADCTILEMKENTDLVQIRPAFGGNIMAQIVTPNARPQFCTVRYRVFSAPARSESPSGSAIEMTVTEEMLKTSTEILEIAEKPKQIDISDADVIVACGRGFKSEADLSLAKELAEKLHAQLACTRPLIEAGWMDPRRQIGLSGRTVKPKLILTLGVSGSVQFAAGMKGSDLIIAVNNDPSANIFDIAHIGIVGDLYEIIPKLLNRIDGGAFHVS